MEEIVEYQVLFVTVEGPNLAFAVVDEQRGTDNLAYPSTSILAYLNQDPGSKDLLAWVMTRGFAGVILQAAGPGGGGALIGARLPTRAEIVRGLPLARSEEQKPENTFERLYQPGTWRPPPKAVKPSPEPSEDLLVDPLGRRKGKLQTAQDLFVQEQNADSPGGKLPGDDLPLHPYAAPALGDLTKGQPNAAPTFASFGPGADRMAAVLGVPTSGQEARGDEAVTATFDVETTTQEEFKRPLPKKEPKERGDES